MKRKIISISFLIVLLFNLFGCQVIDNALSMPQQPAENSTEVYVEEEQSIEEVGMSENGEKPATAEGDKELTTGGNSGVEVEVSSDGKITITLPNTGLQQSSNQEEADEYLVQSDVPAVTVPNDTTYYGYSYMHGTEFYGHEIYEFDDTLTRGSVSMSNLSRYSINTLDYEAYYGITAYTDDYDLYVKAYNHSNDHTILSSTIVSDMGDIEEININYDDYTVIDCRELDYGLYNIVVQFDTNTVDMYFFVAENGVYTCRNTIHIDSSLEDVINRKRLIYESFEQYGVTPEECLSNDEIAYPCIESPGHRCDTERWAQLSHDLILEDTEWSDEFITFAYVEWFLNNIKYDSWRIDNGSSRALEYGVWDGTYSMWDLKVGVCCDFTNALVIMLREQGIPATSFENNTHMWLAVYLDGEWREIDVTTIMPYHSYEQDASDCINHTKTYDDYGNTKTDDILYIGRDIWTYNRIINGTNY